ncbi:MAG: SPOR domain-containing protein [Pseudomonadota bacterium]
MKRFSKGAQLIGVAALALLAGCDTANLPFLQRGAQDSVTNPPATKLVERDIEAPDVFEVSENGLWDGRPSLGGVWVAHPTVAEPERVIIRNQTNGKFVIGALFKRERDIAGPRLQVSSDAANALGMLAGSPTALTVIALRRETVAAPTAAPATLETVPEAGAVATITLDDAPDAAEGSQELAAATLDALAPNPQPIPSVDGAAPAAVAVAVAPAAAPAQTTPAASRLEKPFVQIGIFSLEPNARRTADRLRAAGIIPTVYDQESNGKRFWRVVVGPSATAEDRAAILNTVKSLGFSDAYSVTN